MEWNDDKKIFVGVQQVSTLILDPSSVLMEPSVPKLSQTASKQYGKSNKTLQ